MDSTDTHTASSAASRTDPAPRADLRTGRRARRRARSWAGADFARTGFSDGRLRPAGPRRARLRRALAPPLPRLRSRALAGRARAGGLPAARRPRLLRVDRDADRLPPALAALPHPLPRGAPDRRPRLRLRRRPPGRRPRPRRRLLFALRSRRPREQSRLRRGLARGHPRRLARSASRPRRERTADG